MGFSSLCALAFCVHVATIGHDVSDLEMQLDDVAQQNHLGIFNFTNMIDMLEYDVKTKIQMTIHTTVVKETEKALTYLHKLAGKAKAENLKDPDICYDKFKQQIMSNASETIRGLKPCLEVVNIKYERFSRSLMSSKVRSQDLEVAIKNVRSLCEPLEKTERYECVKEELQESIRKLNALKEEYRHFLDMHHQILWMTSDAEKCVVRYKSDYDKTMLNNVMLATECLQILPVTIRRIN